MPLPRSHRFLGRLPRGSCSPGVSPFLDFVAPPPSVALRPLQLQVSPPGAVWKLPRRRAIPEGRALFRAHRERTRRPIRSSRVRPRGLSPPRRVAPQRGCRSVAPCSGHGVHRVLRVGPPVPRPKPGPGHLARPTVRSPLDEFHSSAAVPHHCGRCLLAVPPPSSPREGCPPAPAHSRCEHLDASHDARWRATSASAAIVTATPGERSPTHSVVPHPPSSPAPQLPAAQTRIQGEQRAAHQRHREPEPTRRAARCQAPAIAGRRPMEPTSRPCSADESVTSVAHCWYADALSIHGFMSPFKACSLHDSRRQGTFRCAPLFAACGLATARVPTRRSDPAPAMSTRGRVTTAHHPPCPWATAEREIRCTAATFRLQAGFWPPRPG
jgi:hypothetical protein